MKRKNIVGENLRKMRKTMGLSQEEVALRSNLTQGYINQLENGKRLFTQKSLEQIAKGLEVPIIDFFKKDEKEADRVGEEVTEYRYKGAKALYKKEVLALLNELPAQLKQHYLNLLRLEKELWKK